MRTCTYVIEWLIYYIVTVRHDYYDYHHYYDYDYDYDYDYVCVYSYIYIYIYIHTHNCVIQYYMLVHIIVIIT